MLRSALATVIRSAGTPGDRCGYHTTAACPLVIGMLLELRPLSSLDARRDALRVGDVLELPAFRGAVVVGGTGRLDAIVEFVNVMQIPTDRFAGPKQLLLANARTFADARSLCRLLAALRERGVAGVAIREDTADMLVEDPEVVDLADELALPVIRLPRTSHLMDVQAGVLELLVTRQSHELQESARVREELTDFALTGEGLDRLVDFVATLVRGDVWLLDRRGHLIERSSAADPGAIDQLGDRWARDHPSGPVSVDDQFVIQPVMVGLRVLGGLVAALPFPVDPVRLAALQHGATVASFKLGFQDEARELLMRYRGEAVADLLSGRLSPEAARRRVRTAGWDLGRRYWSLLVQPMSLRDVYWWLLDRSPTHAMLSDHDGASLIVVADDETPTDLIQGLLDVDPRVRIGVSRPQASIDSFARAVSEARDALRVATSFDRVMRVRHYDDVNALWFLADVPPHQLAAFVDEVLAPLASVEEDFRSVLIGTLEHILEANLNLAQAARAANLHYNTLRYRVDRLTELFGPFLENGAILDSLALALSLRGELHTEGSV
jgi:purine catabolism regulator